MMSAEHDDDPADPASAPAAALEVTGLVYA